MAKQKMRLKEKFTKELVSIDNVVVNLVEVEQGKKKILMPLASISGSNLEAQVDFGPNVLIETTTPEGKNLYYKVRPTLDSNIVIPREEGFYSIENAEMWIDTTEENKSKHILRVKSGEFVLSGKFKKKDDLPF